MIFVILTAGGITKMQNEYEEKIKKLKQELLIMKTLSIKPNYSELSRKYKIDRRTIKKYNEGYSREDIKRKRKSKLDPLKEEIREKIELPGVTITGLYQYFSKDKDIGAYTTFYRYIKKNNLKPSKNNRVHLRYETDFGKQLQFDWKEDVKMISKHGELYEFNIFSATLGASRLHVFIYSKFKTRIDVQRCLIKTFKYIGGTPKEVLTDNMSSIVNTKTHEFSKEFIAFTNDMQIKPKKCKPRHPYTKGKDESANRFMSWLIPYNHEFEDEEELIRIIKEINLKVNRQVNSTIGVAPIMLFNKEKEYLNPLPNPKVIEQYLIDTVHVKISNESLFYYKGKRYSVPNKFINSILDLQEDNNKLYVYYNKNLITIHDISEKNINYKEEHYREGLRKIMKNKTQEEIEELAKKNLEKLNKLCEVK